MSVLTVRRSIGMALAVSLWSVNASPVQAQVGIDQILKYRPVQPGVEIESPRPDELAQCKVEVERNGKASGWIVYGPAGQILRRFIDTDGDNVVDHWCYYQHGLEVYRDIDTNANNEVDQSRWLNMGGTRWGVDSDEDGKIDRWLRISAEEASREAIHAMAARDAKALSALLLDANDLRALGMTKETAAQITAALADPARKVQETLSKSRTITNGTKWVRFDSSLLMPNLVPKEAGKADRDLHVYENVMVIVDNNGTNGFVQIGEMVQVGDVWKLAGIPRPIDGTNNQVVAGGILMQPTVAALTGGSMSLSPEVQALVDQLQQLDSTAPGLDANRDVAVRYNTARAQLLGRLAEVASTQEERDLWLRQRIDGIAAAIQMSAYPNGLAELQTMEQALRQKNPQSELLPYVAYYRLASDYNVKLQSADGEQRSKIQEDWITSLEKYVTDFPKSENAADALLQLGVAKEFLGKPDEAKTWYERLVREQPSTPAGQRGTGALRRLNLPGTPLNLAGNAMGGGTLNLQQYRGKVVAVVFWATWCRPCTEELPQLIEVYRANQPQGFEVVGVNLDSPGAPVQQYIQEHRVPWKHIAEEGGLESRPAKEFGIITLPTTFLIDKAGNVVTTSTSLDSLKAQLPELLQGS